MGFVGVGDIGQPPHKATNTPRTNRMEIQNFDNQTTGKTRSHRPPTPLTSLAEMKITAQLTITTTKHMRLLSSTGDGAAPLRWPPVAVYLRSHRWLRNGRSSSGRARSEPRQKNVASSRHERHRASSVPDARTETLILLSCVHLHLRDERDIFMLK